MSTVCCCLGSLPSAEVEGCSAYRTNTLKFRYMKYLYPYECEKKKLSSPSELQAAIDGNRREGRRNSFNPYSQMSPTLLSRHINGTIGKAYLCP
ncbi:unnamed protein product [Soboliphyme baturini]|uniref:Uncharacterized protein n=1 Tax=Soboliphyme baturini TaxID=241478 RepID=A0A183JAY5_9BILA|nr:unnamed protein product [Soboliphyme baturini]